MRLQILSSAVLLIGVGCVVAGQAQAGAGNGPGPLLNEDTCTAIWTMLSPNGATLSNDQVVPYVQNFNMVDTTGDGSIDAGEFQAGCQAGWLKYPETNDQFNAFVCPAHTCYHGYPFPGCYRC
jgi:hypothetical protein